MIEIIKAIEELYSECFNDIKVQFKDIDDETCHKITQYIMSNSVSKVFNF